MTAAAFDTLAYAEELQKAGLPEAHAKAHAKALAEALKSGIAELATKADLKAMHLELRRDIEALRVEVKHSETNLKRDIEALRVDMKTMETHLIVRLGALMAVGLTALGVLIKIL